MNSIDLDKTNIDPRYLTMFAGYDDILMASDVAKVLKMDSSTLYKKLRSGEIKCLRFHCSVRIPKIWLIEYVIEVGEKVALSITERHKQGILDFCYKPRSRRELQRHLGMTDKGHFMRTILRPLMEEGKICLTIPEKHDHVKQKYVAVKIEGQGWIFRLKGR